MMKKLVKLCIFALLPFGMMQPVNAEVAVIVHLENSADVNDKQIKRLFLGKAKSFDGGLSATAVNLPEGNAIRQDFEKKILKKTANQLKAYWSRLIFTGKARPPKELASDADIKAQVAGNIGSIGYIDASQADDTVKVVKTF